MHFFLFLHLLLLWTCAFADVQEVSYFSLLHAYLFIILTQRWEVMYFFLFLHLLLLWTCAFANAQHVSYFSLLSYFYHCDKKCGEWHEICFSLSPLATSMNLCIRLCSACKLLFITLLLLSLWPKSVVSDMKFVFLFFHLLLLWTCAFADVQEVSYFSLLHAYLFIILTQSVGSDVLFSLSPLATSVNFFIR